MRLADVIRDFIVQELNAGKSQIELAKEMDMSRPGLNKYIHGVENRVVYVENLEKLAVTRGMSLKDFLNQLERIAVQLESRDVTPLEEKPELPAKKLRPKITSGRIRDQAAAAERGHRRSEPSKPRKSTERDASKKPDDRG